MSVNLPALVPQDNLTTLAATPTNWRSILPIHPAAELFPRMSPDELKALGEDIRANGLTSPIAITASRTEIGWTYRLLDGRNRLDAMEAVGILFRLELIKGQCCVILLDLDHGFSDANVIESDPYAYVCSANIYRRHLKPEEKRELIAKLLTATPEKSNRQIAETAKASHVTVGAVRAEMEATGQIDQLTKTVGKDGRARPNRVRAADAVAGNDVSAIARTKNGASPPRDDIGPGRRFALNDVEIGDLQNAKRRRTPASRRRTLPQTTARTTR